MRHLILGCGYLGQRVARLWLERGHAVHAVTRKEENARHFRELGIQSVLCDVLDPVPLKELSPFDTVLYAVGLDRSGGASMRQVYVEGLERVLQALAPPGKMIYVSSTSVYGQSDGSWVDEESVTKPAEESGRIVLEAETVLRRYIPGALLLRFAGIYGPGRLLRQKAIQAGEPIVGDGEKWLNLIHMEDGARAVLAAEEAGPPGLTVNVADGQPVRRREFFGELARLLNAPPPRFVAHPKGAALPPHEKGHRRISNQRLREVLCFQMKHPDYREGLKASLNIHPDW